MRLAGQSPSEQGRRRSARAKVFLSATLEWPDRVLPVVLRDLSEHGALIEVTELVFDDSEVVLRRGRLRVPGHIAWAHGKFAGIAFTHCLNREIVMQHVARPPARRIEEPVHRRPAVTQRGMTAEERRWFDEITRRPGEGGDK